MLEVFEDVLRQQSTDGEIYTIRPHEMQQYINEDNEKSLLVKNLVEKTSGGFDSRVLIVSTGQAALKQIRPFRSSQTDSGSGGSCRHRC